MPSHLPSSRRTPELPRRALLGLPLLAALALSGCADPAGAKANAENATPGTATGTTTGTGTGTSFNLDPDQHRVRSKRNAAAVAALPDKIRSSGRLLVATTGTGNPPLSFTATDNTTIIGSEPDIAQLVADGLGLTLELQQTAWADWPLGVQSGKYDVVFSNVTVTEKRKQLFDFATYRNDVLGFYAKADSGITSITGASDVAGKRIIVGSGTNQEKILLAWDADNTAAGLPAVAFQYYDDEAAASLAIQSGRADLTFGPNATGAYQAASTGRTKLVGTVSGGFPLKAEIAATTAKDNGLVAALQLALQEAFDNGSYAEVLKRWNLTAEAIDAPQTNPAGLPDT